MVIEQWGFFSMPHLLWHGASFYNGHLQESVTATLIAERLAEELLIPAFTTWTINIPLAEPTLLPTALLLSPGIKGN